MVQKISPTKKQVRDKLIADPSYVYWKIQWHSVESMIWRIKCAPKNTLKIQLIFKAKNLKNDSLMVFFPTLFQSVLSAPILRQPVTNLSTWKTLILSQKFFLIYLS